MSGSIQAIANAYDADPTEVITRPEDGIVVALRDPKWKKNVNAVIAHTHLTEDETRLRAWELTKIPARRAAPDADDGLDARITHAFNQLLST